MDTKLTLTKKFLEDLNLPTDSKTVKKYLHSWWKNPRSNGERSLGLTPEGYSTFKDSCGLKFYQIDLPKEIFFSNQLVVWLDKYIDCPFYQEKNTIWVTRERVAVELILFGGDLFKYGQAKNKSRTQQVH